MIPTDRLVSVTVSGSPTGRVEPVTLVEARAQLNDPPISDNTLIEGYIAAARGLFEDLSGRQTIEAVWEYTCYPVGRIVELPRAPLLEVLEVVARDATGGESTLDPSTYRVVLSGVETGSPATIALDDFCPPGRIELAVGSVWPGPEIRVRRRCGYGTTPEQIPRLIKAALHFLIGHFYRNRAEVTAEAVMSIPLGAEALMRGFKYSAMPVYR